MSWEQSFSMSSSEQQYFVLLQFHKFFVTVENPGVHKVIRTLKLLSFLSVATSYDFVNIWNIVKLFDIKGF